MRKPSRLMPEYEREPLPIIGRILAWAIAIPLLAIAIPCFIILLPIFLLSKNDDKAHDWYERIDEERIGESICTFARSFDCRKVDTWVIRAVYEQIQNYLKRADYPDLAIRSEDHLFNTLPIDEEDFFLGIDEEISQRTGRTCDFEESNPMNHKVETVGDLVHFYNNQPRIQSA